VNRFTGRFRRKGNPTLKTLAAVLKTVGLRLSVEPEHVEAA
jgi:DNA-binding phage protein